MNSSQQQFYRAYRATRLCDKNGAGMDSMENVLVRDPRTNQLKIIRWGANEPSFKTQLAASECLDNLHNKDKLECRKPLQILRAQKVIKENGKQPNLFGLIVSAHEVLTTLRLHDINA